MRNILWSVGGGGAVAIAGGFTRESFMNEAFFRMTAAEQVACYFGEYDSLSIVNLALTFVLVCIFLFIG